MNEQELREQIAQEIEWFATLDDQIPPGTMPRLYTIKEVANGFANAVRKGQA